MTSRKIDLMLTAIKNQNEYDYKLMEDKQRINKNIQKYKNESNKKHKIKKEIFNLNNNINADVNNKDYETTNPLESVEYNSKRLIPIIKDNIYNYSNKYNFNRKKALNQNKKNRMRINKSMDLKLSIYTLNKNNYINNIKNIFSQRNALNRKKTEAILQHIKQSNEELRKNIKIKHAIKFNNFVNYVKMKNIENDKYNDIINKKMKLAKDKYNIGITKKFKEIKPKINDKEKMFKNKNIKTINVESINKRLFLNKEKIKELNDKNKEKIIEKENKNFLKAKNIEDKINQRKNNALISDINRIKRNEIKLDEAKEIYERIYKSDVIYKKEKL